jgi:type III secretory pathway lipoprotein EscJ
LFPPYERENAAVYIAVSDGEYINTIIWLLKNAIAGIVIQRISVISHSDRKGGKDFQYKR